VTTTTVVPGTIPTGAGVVPDDFPGVGSGDSAATSEGKPVEVTVTNVDGSLSIAAAESSVSLTVRSPDGALKTFSSRGIELGVGDRIDVSVRGAGTGSNLEVWMKPDDVRIGRTTVEDTSGTLQVQVPGDLDPGDKRLVVLFEDPQGRSTAIAHGVRIAGSDSGGPSWSLVFLFIVGGSIAAGFLIPAARRRRDDEEQHSSRA